MAQRNTIPKGARRVATLGPVTTPDGIVATAERWRGVASDGYKTDYTARTAEWLIVKANGRTYLCQRFTGKRLAKAEREWTTMTRDFAEAAA